MKSFLTKTLIILAVTAFCLSSTGSFAADIRPYRVALVIGDQWDDPMSYVVTHRKGFTENQFTAVKLSDDFSSLVIMFKNCGIPFDIVRLDQEFMDINRFVGPDDKPRVGCILWDVDTTAELQPQRYEVIRQAVNDYGISLIALGDRIKQPIIQEVLGLKYIGTWGVSEDLEHRGDHFITKALKSPLDNTDRPIAHKKRIQVELKGAKPIVMQGKYPQVTVRETPSGARNVWIGSDVKKIFQYQPCRILLRRAITWAIGYSMYKTWENRAFMIMDDPGTAASAWLEHWNYPQLTEEVIDKYLIKPLKEHNGILIVNVPPGFVNDKLQRVEPSFQRVFTDEFGNKQDFPSLKRGLIKGIKEGVLEIQCHGLTHMQPDLWSPPGPWYGSDLDGERAEVAWYQEFGDGRRNKEIPGAEACWRLKTAREWIEYTFGIPPLSFHQGQGAASFSYVNHTLRQAARAGFGWYSAAGGYLGSDMVVHGGDFVGALETPIRVRMLPDGHDRGITIDPDGFRKVFELYPDVEWMGTNELVGYTHAKLSGGGRNSVTIKAEYDDHYCTYFKDRQSNWNLLVSDWLAEELPESTISVDGKAVIKNADFSTRLKVVIPAGLGTHTINIK